MYVYELLLCLMCSGDIMYGVWEEPMYVCEVCRMCFRLCSCDSVLCNFWFSHFLTTVMSGLVHFP